MIATSKKPITTILKTLKGKEKIFIVGCGECATTCETGSEKAVMAMKKALEAKGKQVPGWVVPDAPCVAAQIKSALSKNIKAVKESEAFLVLACGSGVQAVKEADRSGKDVYSGCDTMFAATVNAKGDFEEKCSACGDCILEFTAGICPVTRCSKGLLNGPCGGVQDGKCEVDRDKDCIWIKIHDELKRLNKPYLSKETLSPKDFSKAKKPRSLSLGG